MTKIQVFNTFNDAFIELNKEENDRKNLEACMIMYERYKAQDKDTKGIGSGLELICAAELVSVGGRYSYMFVPTSTMVPLSTPLNNEYRTVKKLALSVKGKIATTERSNFGAVIKPLFYTVAEQKPIFSDEDKAGMREFQQSMKEDEDFKSMPFYEKIASNLLLKLMIKDNTLFRGLTEQERQKFESIYDK